MNIKAIVLFSAAIVGTINYVTCPEVVVEKLILPHITSTPPPEEYVAESARIPRTVPVIDSVTQADVECLTKNIYFEAKNQSLAGQLAVGIVTLNRVAHSRWPNTVCGVVKQARVWNGHPIRNQCQFSWYCDGKPDVFRNKDAHIQARQLAEALLDPEAAFVDFTEGADHYHADYILPPSWTSMMVQVTQVDNHIFYVRTL